MEKEKGWDENPALFLLECWSTGRLEYWKLVSSSQLEDLIDSKHQTTDKSQAAIINCRSRGKGYCCEVIEVFDLGFWLL